MKFVIYKIKTGKRETWEAWCRSILNEHRSEAIDTLREENILYENCYILGEADNSYVLFSTEEGVGGKKATNLERELNQVHLCKLKECLERVSGPIIVGYELENNQSRAQS